MTIRSGTCALLLLTVVPLAHTAKCEFSDGNYRLQWLVDSSNIVHFLFTYRNYPVNRNSWTGVAFGESMISGLDAIIIQNINGQINVSDNLVLGYGPAQIDNTQNVKVEAMQVKNDVLQVKFSRPVNTFDMQADMPLDGCKKWQFITSINPVYGIHTGKHVLTPIGQQVCLNKCRS